MLVKKRLKAKHPGISDRTRHVDVEYHYVREQVLTTRVQVHFVPTAMCIADIFTKKLIGRTFKQLAHALIDYKNSELKRMHDQYILSGLPFKEILEQGNDI